MWRADRWHGRVLLVALVTFLMRIQPMRAQDRSKIEIVPTPGHSQDVVAMAFSPDGPRVVGRRGQHHQAVGRRHGGADPHFRGAPHKASPLARKLAEQHDVDIAKISYRLSTSEGRIIGRDLRKPFLHHRRDERAVARKHAAARDRTAARARRHVL